MSPGHLYKLESFYSPFLSYMYAPIGIMHIINEIPICNLSFKYQEVSSNGKPLCKTH